MLSAEHGILEPVLPGGYNLRKKGHQATCRVHAGRKEKHCVQVGVCRRQGNCVLRW